MIEGLFDYIGREVLAVSITEGPGEGAGAVLDLETDEGPLPARAWLRKAQESS